MNNRLKRTHVVGIALWIGILLIGNIIPLSSGAIDRYEKPEVINDILKDIEIYPPLTGESRYSGIVIITTNDIAGNSEQLEYFITMKQQMGNFVYLVTEDSYGGLTGPPPNGLSEKIRQWLINAWEFPLVMDYVLLIGNPDPDDTKNPSDPVGDVPMKMCWPKYFLGGTGNPTDLYYGDLDSDWDLDGDCFYYELKNYNSPKSPDPSIDDDTFSVFWTGDVMCDYDVVYTFRTLSDDGVRLMIDGEFVIDHWDEHDLCFDIGTVSLSAGLHDISVFFRENYGDGIIKLYWKNFIEDTYELIPSDHLYDADGNVGGLTGFYYDNNDFTEYKLTRKDSKINFEWGTGDIGHGNPDLEAEVYVGRIPVYDNDYEQLDKILRKIIDYEMDPGDISWRKSILLPMVPMDYKTTSTGLGEAIKQFIAMPNGFSYFRIYDENYDPPTPELWPCNYENTWNEWKNGYGMVTWHTHGGQEHASRVIHRDNLSNLDDSKPAFTFQASCSNACPENKNNLAYSLLKHGGVAMVAGTRMTSYQSGEYHTFTPTSNANHQMAYYYTLYVIDYEMPAGKALNEVVKGHTELSPNAIRYNLYGDPDCYLLSTTPNDPPSIPIIVGPTSGKPGTLYTYYITLYDPDEDDIVEYIINWGDEPDETITGPFAPGSIATANHTWSAEGKYTIKAKSIDIYGAESGWGELEVTMPRDKATNNMLWLRLLERFPLLQKLLLRFGL